jgi:hypothetical protein
VIPPKIKDAAVPTPAYAGKAAPGRVTFILLGKELQE